MSLIKGISELRDAISQPEDPLFGQLTDLITALNEATGLKPENEAVPIKNKRKKCKRTKDTVEISGSNVGGSESNFEEINAKPREIGPNLFQFSKFTDSDNELSWQTSGRKMCRVDAKKVESTVTPHAWRARTPFGQQSDDAKMTKLKFFRSPVIGMLAPIESDSFTETFTPTRRCRKKRLIKKMAVDHVVENEIPSSSTSYRLTGHNFCANGNISNKSMFLSPKYRPNFYNGRYAKKSGSCNSESSMECDFGYSETSESDGNVSSNDGHQGDDEHSDWYLELPSHRIENHDDQCCHTDDGHLDTDEFVMGVPDIKKFLMRKMAGNRATSKNFGHYMQIIESSDTDISQSSNSLRCSTKIFAKRLLSKNIPSMTSALNRRILVFLDSQVDLELPLGTLKKRERKEAFRLASFYNLNVCCKTTKGVQNYALVKTKYTVKL